MCTPNWNSEYNLPFCLLRSIMCQLSACLQLQRSRGGTIEMKDYKFLNMVQQKNQTVVVLSEAQKLPLCHKYINICYNLPRQTMP